ncbi:MAG: FAD-dependent oxidoreductase, partial [Candidatus Obscuribacterales bacterium]|nr:FAD-dependent oxidoreductase [Candidatus Obscuribacterales bacterium]
IITAGAWTGPMLRGMGLLLPLQVSEEQYSFFKALKAELFEIGKFPVFLHYGSGIDDGIGWYGMPIFNKDGVKSSVHKSGKHVTAKSRDFEPSMHNLEKLQERMKKFLPDAAGEILSTSTCLYTNTPDSHFIIDHPAGRENTCFFAGCSGHAFKFAPLIAQMLIDLINKKESLAGIELFSSKRFQ